jgi:adenylate cyclase
MIPASAILKAKLLIVDDLVANVMLLERLLSNAGYSNISSTQNPLEVIDLHRQNRYDLILLDLNMPEMDGFQVMEDLKSIETEGILPVLVITAQPNEKLRALKAGALDFLSKPFDIAEVLARVQNLLQVRLLNLETQKLYEQVLIEQDLSELLLHNVLPQAIAERLKGRSKCKCDGFVRGHSGFYRIFTIR